MKSRAGSSLASPYAFSFLTTPFQISIYPSDGSTGVSRGTQVQVDCNSKYDTSTVREAFSITPTVSGALQLSGNEYYYPSFVFFPTSNTSFAANTQYTVTVSTALKAIDGTSLPQTVTSTFTTGQY